MGTEDWTFAHLKRTETLWGPHGYHRYPAKFIPQLVSRLIETYSAPGALVGDPFLGSATIGVEALRLGRRFWGSDISEVALTYKDLAQPGKVSIIDLSDTDSPQVNNLVIAEFLRGLLEAQNENYREAVKNNTPQCRTMIIIEEAHEFLSAERIRQMPILYQQVARIARRGRKRWLGLAFVTQLPQHLPDEVLGLVNNYILHKIADANVISRLKRSLGGVDDSLWNRLPNLAPGQALVTMSSFARPLLVNIDPTPCKLRMVE